MVKYLKTQQNLSQLHFKINFSILKKHISSKRASASYNLIKFVSNFQFFKIDND